LKKCQSWVIILINLIQVRSRKWWLIGGLISGIILSVISVFLTYDGWIGDLYKLSFSLVGFTLLGGLLFFVVFFIPGATISLIVEPVAGLGFKRALSSFQFWLGVLLLLGLSLAIYYSSFYWIQIQY